MTAVASAANTPTPEEWADARRFRATFGLRADDAWILAVAADPSSAEGRATYGVPLMPAELADLLNRPRVADDSVWPIIDAYGRGFPDEWAGLIVDQRHGGLLAAQFTDRTAIHREALRALVPADFPFEVLEVGYSLADLDRLRAQVAVDAAWFESIGAKFHSTEVSTLDNVVDVRFTGPDRAATDAVEAHFDRPDWLRAVWAGPGPWTGPTGTLVVEVVDTAGRARSGLGCVIRDSVQPVFQGDPVDLSTVHGRCIYENYPAVTYDITITDESTEPATPLATERVHVAAGDPTVLRITIAP